MATSTMEANMTKVPFTKPSMSLKEALDAAALAEKRVESWPEWKRELSFYSLSPPEAASARVRDVVSTDESSSGVELEGR